MITLSLWLACASVQNPSVTAPTTTVEDWPALALRDLEGMRDTLLQHHPGPVDTEDRTFAEWLESGFAEASEHLPRVTGEPSYRALLRSYASGFQDGHLSVRFPDADEALEWPGIMVGLRQERVVVTHAGEAELVGAELLGCDDQGPFEYLETEVFPFVEAVPHLVSDQRQWMPWLLLHEPGALRARPSRCAFRTSKGMRTVALSWSPTTRSALAGHLAAAQFGARPNFAQGAAGDGIWVSMPHFSGASDGLVPIVDAAPSWRSARFVVFDVRGNTGGSSAWGQQLVAGLYGEAALTALKRQVYPPDLHVAWRASIENAQHLRALLPQIRQSGGEEVVAYFEGVTAGLEQAVADDALFYLDRADPSRPAAPEEAPASNALAVLLTDGACASACLDFADLVLRLPRHLHLGYQTSADSYYMENRTVPLPSRRATLSFAIKVYRNRPRGHNEPYNPDRWYRGDFSDQETLQEWVLDEVERALGPLAATPPHAGGNSCGFGA